MKSKLKKIYILEFLFFIYILFYKYVILEFFYKYAFYINMTILLLSIFFLLIIYGIPKDKHYLKNRTIKNIVILMLLYFIISYLLGLFTGFYQTVFSHKFKNILFNIFPIFINILIIEIIRYTLLRKCFNKLSYFILIFLFIFLNLLISLNNIVIINSEQFFILISLTILPIISRELLYSYLTYKISLIPTLILHLSLELYIYIIPILPDLGNYLSSLLGVLFPYIVYYVVHKDLIYHQKNELYFNRNIRNIFLTFISLVLLSLILLTSGFFKYHMIAIGSNSMMPIYERGDAIIYKKEKSSNVKEGDILVFRENNILITHRVIEIIKSNNHYQFITKGDNNLNNDNFKVEDKNVLGVVKYIVKYVGYPTIWLGGNDE